MHKPFERGGLDQATLRAEVEALRAEVQRLKEDVRFWNETAIEYKRQLFETIRRGPESAGLHIIANEQIDHAVEHARRLEASDPPCDDRGHTQADGVWNALAAIGIVECPECGGWGAYTGTDEDHDMPVQRNCKFCNAHGWIREERGDE